MHAQHVTRVELVAGRLMVEVPPHHDVGAGDAVVVSLQSLAVKP